MPLVNLALHAMATRFELVLHGENAQFAPSPFFVSAAPFDLKGDFTLTAIPNFAVPEPASFVLLGLGMTMTARWRERSR